MRDIERTRWRLYLRARVVGLVLLAAFALTAPSPVDPAVGWFTLAVAVPLNVAALATLDRLDAGPWFLAAVDAVVLAVAVKLDPDIAVVAGALLVAGGAQAAAAGWRRTLIAVGVGLPFLVVGLVEAVPELAVTIVVTHLGTTPFVAWLLASLAEAESQERRAHRDLLDGIDAVVWEARPHPEDGLRVEGRCEVLLGRTADELAAPGAWDDLIDPDTRERVVERRRRLITAGRDHESTYPVRTPSGRVRHLRERVRVGVDADGRPATARAVVIDVTETVSAAERLRRRALHDELTGLANRALLAERLDHAVRWARRSGSPVALLLLDLDQFKEVNDSLGHDQGDRLLVAVAHRLREHVRESDTLARLGGDEFAVLLDRDVTPRTTLQVAERILTCFDRPFELDALSLQVGASLGVAIHPEHGTTAADLRRHADTAMYTAKRRGGGLAVYDPDRNRSSTQRLSLLSELRRAIDGGELLVHYQPVVTLSTGRIEAVEALLRWRHPRQGLVGPGEFLEGAEVAGIIRPLTQWVLGRSLDDLDRWRRAGLDLRVAVNVSVRNLYETTFADDVRRLLAAHRVDPARLTLEITETQVVDDLARAHTALSGLTALGVGIAIDDFGTGHASLANLHALDVDEVKIDRSFVAAMEAGDATAETIVRSIISLARSLGLDVVAEGVESPDTVTRLSLLGCDRAQGFWFARPRPADELLAVVADHNRAIDAGAAHHSGADPGPVGPEGRRATLEGRPRVP